jgi:hypothetical protein
MSYAKWLLVELLRLAVEYEIAKLFDSLLK